MREIKITTKQKKLLFLIKGCRVSWLFGTAFQTRDLFL